MNTLTLQSLFNKVASLMAFNFIKNETPTKVFSCEYCKIFTNSFFIEHIQWLQYSGNVTNMSLGNHKKCKRFLQKFQQYQSRGVARTPANI